MELRSINRAATLAILAALAALAVAVPGLASPAPAQAQAQARVAPEEFFGVNGPYLRDYVNYEHDDLLRGLAQSMNDQGIRYARIIFAQDIDNPQPDVWNWFATDRMVEALAREGVRGDALLTGTSKFTSNLLSWLDCGSRAAPYDTGGWGAWVSAAADRYGPGGTFWDQHPDLPELPIKRWEIGNEPNSNIFWCPSADPAGYARIFSASHTAITALDPSAEVMVGGLAPRFDWSTPKNLDVPTFLSGVTAADPSLVEKIGSVAIHPYGETPEDVIRTIGDFRDAMNTAGLDETPMLINEVGWYTSANDGPPELKATEAQRASRIAAVADQVWRTDCNISGLAPYSWITPQENADYFEHWFGMASAETGEPLPSGVAYGDAVRRARGQGPTPPSQETVSECTRHTLTAQRTGAGDVTSSPDGINCPNASCTTRLRQGTDVVLTASAHAGYAFRGWTGCDSVSGTACTVDMNAARAVSANFVLQRDLIVTKTGSGAVTSAPAAINCGTVCSAPVDNGRQFALTATPAPGYGVRWRSGCDAVSGSQCTVTMNSYRSVFVDFVPERTLTVQKNGSGTIASGTGSINCGTMCSTKVDAGWQVSLYATPAAGYAFRGWSGCPSVWENPCHVTMDQDRTVTANFVARRTITVQKTGGTGTVYGSAGGINCGATCSGVVDNGTQMTLTAVPATGFAFKRWVNCDSPSGAICNFTVGGDRTVTAEFEPKWDLAVERSGPGTIGSAPTGIDCGQTCAGKYNPGQSVTLTATPSPGYGVKWYSGCDSVSGDKCTVSMNGNRTIFASFVPAYRVNVTKQGAGSVVSTPAGIDCGATCYVSFDAGWQVNLWATPAPGYVLRGWEGCTVTGPNRCTVQMTADRPVTVHFVARHTVTVQKTGQGTVRAPTAGIDCGSTCSGTVDGGSAHVFEATPAPGYAFRGWTGCESPSGNKCTATIGSDRTIGATFVLQRTLAVQRSGNGTVTSPSGINCGSACTVAVDDGSTQTLKATAAPGHVLRGWTGCDSTAGATCVVRATRDIAVGALFAPAPVVATPPPPDTQITKLKLKPGRKATVTLAATGRSTAVSYLCQMDRQPFRACGTTKTYKLRKGRHTFRAVAVDSLGRQDPTPAVRTFKIKR